MTLVRSSAVCIAMVSVLGGGACQSSEVSSTRLQFRSRIQQIDRQVDLTNFYDVFRSDLFNEMFDNPVTYASEACALMADRQMTTDQKIIIVLGMSQLNFEEYLKFVGCTTAAFDSGSTDWEVMLISLCPPGFNWNTHLVDNWQMEPVRSILSVVAADERVPSDVREFVRETLDGETARSIADERKLGLILPLPRERH